MTELFSPHIISNNLRSRNPSVLNLTYKKFSTRIKIRCIKWLILFLCFSFSASFIAKAQVFSYTSFEEPATIPNAFYTDTGDPSVDHDLINNVDQPPVDYISVGGEMGFDATYIGGTGLGLTEGDFVGVTSFTGNVGSFIDGSQGYQFADTDGTMLLTFDSVSLAGVNSPELALYYFISNTLWETEDSMRIWVEVDGGIEIDLLNTFGQDIDTMGITGSWILASTDLTGYTSATLKVWFVSTFVLESMFLDQITFTELSPGPGCPISLTDTDLGGGAPYNIPTGIYQVSDSISSSGMVASQPVSFDAAVSISLEAGFTADGTADFEALIGGCIAP